MAKSRKATPKFDRDLRRVQVLFNSMPKAVRRRFVNAISDQFAQNPMLGNRGPQRNAPLPPTSGMESMGADDSWDYFRQPHLPKPGQMKTDPAPSITPARVLLSVRMRWNPIKGLTPEKAVTYMDQFRYGFFRQAAMTWDQIQRRDYQLQITWPKAAKSVSRHGYDILTREEVLDDQKSLAQEQQDFLKNFYGDLTATSALEPDQSGGFSLLVRQMMEARLHRYAVHDIAWAPQPDGNLTAKLVYCPLWWFEGTRGKLRFLDSEFQVYGRDMLPGEWLVTVGDGLMEAILAVYIFKWMALKSYLMLLDRFGQPGIHGVTTAVKGSPEWNDFVEAVQEFAQEWSAVSNQGGEIKLIEARATTSGEGPFAPLIEKMDRAITQMLRGGDLGTSSRASGVGASLQEDESEILETDNAKWIEETLDQRVTNFALEWKYGAGCPKLAYLKLRTTPRRNLQDDIAVDEFLLGAGAPLGIEETMERYNRSMPKEGSDLLKAPVKPPMPGQTGQPGQPGDEKIVPPSKTDANPEFANTNQLAVAGKEMVLEAVLAEFQKINADLDAISYLTDPDVQKKRLAQVLADLDKLETQLHHDPALSNAIYKILVAGIGNGLAEKTTT